MSSSSSRERLIMHLDGDAFFVSVEAAKDPSLRGKAVVTGAERGIASALSYEAKKLGITRAMPVFQIRREFPGVIVVDSDYEAYAVFSRRMMDIVRRYADSVEEYSIDECFADFTDVSGFGDGFPSAAAEKRMRSVLSRLKADIRRELGISVSLGLGPTKVLAKTASKSRKPDGLVILKPSDVEPLLEKTPVDKVWGIGSATAFGLRKKGVSTALELAKKPVAWVEEHFSKPLAEMWYELNGVSIRQVGESSGEDQKSIMKTRTFSPASKDPAVVFSELSKNIENACRKARELGLAAREFSLYLKTKDFSYTRRWCRLAVPTQSPFDILREADPLFRGAFVRGSVYRATGITLSGLVPASLRQDDLFGAVKAAEGKAGPVFEALDKINRRYGKSVVRLASSSRAFARDEREDASKRRAAWRLAIPYLGEAL